MIWLLIGLLLLVCLVALGVTVLRLWRRVKALGRQVGEAGEAAARARRTIEDSRVGGPLEVKPCPTCGTRVQAKVLGGAAPART